MEEFLQLANEANRAFKTADHLAYVTYPVVTDKKLLMVIIDNIHQAIWKAMGAILAYEYLYKRINHLPKGFEEQLSVLEDIASQRKIPRGLIAVASEVNDIVRHREKSPIEFVRKDRFIMASENFRLKMVTIEKVKNYIQHIKVLFDRLEEVRLLNDRRIG